MTSARSRRCGRAALGLLVIFAMAAPGCSGYQLQGKVVEGSVSEMAFVAAEVKRPERNIWRSLVS